MSYLHSFKEIIKSLGLVFGDIGTSPIYTLSAVFAVIPPTIINVMGALSLIAWTLILMVMVQYGWLAMSLAHNESGEGGTIVLKQKLIPYLTSKKTISIITLLAFIGIAFFIGDGVITPAISILSAVEGIKLIPILNGLSQNIIVLIAILITIALFLFQKKGTENVSLAFGPIMLIWFVFLIVSGSAYIIKYPYIINAINPYYAIQFFKTNGFIAILILSKIALCATGAEALYADMGHLGRKPIRASLVFVFFALCIIYLGQGAFLLAHPSAHSIFHEMALLQFKAFYIPILFLSVMATVIASQAMISGLFSIVYQGITTHIMPRLHVEYTSQKIMSQIYIPAVNYFLLIFVLLTIIKFQDSTNLANAYGLAVSGSMTITALLLFLVFTFNKSFLKAFISIFLVIINATFLLSNIYKIPYGGYWSLVTAFIPLTLIIIYDLGQKRLYECLRQIPFDLFLEKYLIISEKIPHINGTAIFLTKSTDPIPKYIARTMFINNIIYEENIIVMFETQRIPFGVTAIFKTDLIDSPTLKIFEIKVGYLEHVNIEKILTAADIHPKVIFYGNEDIITKNLIWKVYMIIKKLTPSFVQFYKLPENKLHGVVVQVEM
jgi:KUP system potassium uptake protein